jgi:hypothetical protein
MGLRSGEYEGRYMRRQPVNIVSELEASLEDTNQHHGLNRLKHHCGGCGSYRSQEHSACRAMASSAAAAQGTSGDSLMQRRR